MHRTYTNEDITVFWNSDLCQHAKRCVTGSPEVFEFGRRPWIQLNRGTTSKIWQTISTCPSGALAVVYNHGITVKTDVDNHRSIAIINDEIIGECDYEENGDVWNIYHTHVINEFGGKGIAKRLVYAVLEAAERAGKTIDATCSYAVKVIG